MSEHLSITSVLRDRILSKAAGTESPRAAAAVVLDSLLAETNDLSGYDSDEIKKLLVDALRASQRREPAAPRQLVG